jgi:hypothetical protein
MTPAPFRAGWATPISSTPSATLGSKRSGPPSPYWLAGRKSRPIMNLLDLCAEGAGRHSVSPDRTSRAGPVVTAPPHYEDVRKEGRARRFACAGPAKHTGERSNPGVSERWDPVPCAAASAPAGA